jgi:hypothetical protein
VGRRLRRVRMCRWGVDSHIRSFVNGRRYRDWYWQDGRLRSRAGARRTDGIGPLAAVTTMRELMIVEATSQLGLFQVRGDVLIGHFLKTSLEKIDFL